MDNRFDIARYYEIKGYLKAFEFFNIYTNHGNIFFFEHIELKGGVRESLNEFIDKNTEIREEDSDYYHLTAEFKWENTLRELLYYHFLDVLEQQYTPKYSEQITKDERFYCIDEFIKMLRDFFENSRLYVWSSGVGTGGSILSEVYCTWNAVDFIFKSRGHLFALHLGHCD